MKKVAAFILLICHINFSMLLPQVAEQDSYDKYGTQIDDINSAFEYFDEIILGNVDDTPEDEDNDEARSIHVVKIDHFLGSQNNQLIEHSFKIQDVQIFPEVTSNNLLTISFEIITPPPEA